MLIHCQHTWHFWWCFSRSLLLVQREKLHAGSLHCSMCVHSSLPTLQLQPNWHSVASSWHLAQWRKNRSQRCCLWMYSCLSCMLRMAILLPLGACAALPPPVAGSTAGPTGRVWMSGAAVAPTPMPDELLCIAGANTGMIALSSMSLHVATAYAEATPAICCSSCSTCMMPCTGCCCPAAKPLCTVQSRKQTAVPCFRRLYASVAAVSCCMWLLLLTCLATAASSAAPSTSSLQAKQVTHREES
jgi:hypothetical protein